MITKLFIRVDAALNRFGVLVTGAVSSMWCAIAFGCLALISLPDAIRNGRASTVAWLAQTFLQLVLLSIIMVGQEVQAAKLEQRDAETHETVMASHREIIDSHHEAHETLQQQNAVLSNQDSLLEEIYNAIKSIVTEQ